MRRYRALVGLVVAPLFLVVPGPAAAVPVTDFEMPFPCGEVWTGTTRAEHSPSYYSVDWNRPDDVGDPVVASAAGKVVTAVTEDHGSYGLWVQIDHGNNERTLYAHLQAVVVSVGQTVRQGQLIGRLGTSGNSTGPHLHYEQKRYSTVTRPYFHGEAYVFGRAQASQNCQATQAIDVPIAGDWDGDAKGQLGVFRRNTPAEWHLRRPDGGVEVTAYGHGTDAPVSGDWDGNGTHDLGVRKDGLDRFVLRLPGTQRRINFGKPTDTPIAGNWGGDAKWEIGVWTPSTATFSLRFEDGTVKKVPLGESDDLPVTGDWDGNGITDLGVFDQARRTWRLRMVDETNFVWRSNVRWGGSTELPVVGDWDGDRVTDLGVWNPATAEWTTRVVVDGRPVLTRLVWGRPR